MELKQLANDVRDFRPHVEAASQDARPIWRPWPAKPAEPPSRPVSGRRRPQSAGRVQTTMSVAEIEKEVSQAFGIERYDQVPRLPIGLEYNRQGSRVFWQWVARAALEYVTSQTYPGAELADIISKVKSEIQESRTRSIRDAAKVAAFERSYTELEAMKIDLVRTNAKYQLNQKDNIRLMEEKDDLQKMLAQAAEVLADEKKRNETLTKSVEEATKTIQELEEEAEVLENRLDAARLKQEIIIEHRGEDQHLLKLERTENARIKQEALEVAMIMARKKKRRPLRKRARGNSPGRPYR